MSNRLVVHTTPQIPLRTLLEDSQERRVVVHYEEDADALRDSHGLNIRSGVSLTKSLIIKGTLILKIRQNETTTVSLLTN